VRIIVTGKNGQLGQELQRSVPNHYEVLFCNSSELDITNSKVVSNTVNEFKPDVVINAAAYTAGDKAETDIDACYAVNETGVKNLALACKEVGAKLLHVSTDFVFDAAKNTPYQPSDATNPLGVYGASKLAGERAAQDILKQDVSIVRTAWVYSCYGNNFVKTMLRLMSDKPQLGVVADQVGTPTSAKNLAKALWQLASSMQTKQCDTIYHWTDLGTTSWYDFAVAIQELGLAKNLLKSEIPVLPINAAQYPTPAKRPAYSVLDSNSLREELSLNGEHWRKALTEVINEL
jgi:dTDP-4-dehydrorhamnose reductase